MTVNTDIATASYTGNGATAIFSVPFYFLADADLKVSKLTAAGVSSVLVLNSDYTVTGAGVEDGGSITSIPVLPTGDKIFIERNVDAVQQTEYPVNGAFPAASHERALDRLTMLAQQVIAKLTFGLFRDPLAATYNAGGNTISNVADAVNAQDVPSLGQTQTLVAGAATGIIPSLIVKFTDLIASSGSALIGFLQSGTGAVARTAKDKLLEVTVSPEDFGAVGNGVTDDYAAITAAITYLSGLGGGTLQFGAKTYAVMNTIAVQQSNIRLVGKGSHAYHDGGTGQTSATSIKWINAIAGVVISCSTPKSVGSAMVSKVIVRDIRIDANALANNGIVITSVRDSTFEDILVENAISVCYAITTAPNGTISEAQDTQHCRFIRCRWKCTATAAVQGCHGMQLTSAVPGTSTANASFNYFENCQGQTYNGTGFWLIDADNNTFNMCSAQIVVGTGTPLTIAGAYSNYFYNWSNTVRIQGTATGAWRDATGNCFFNVDEANGTAYPTIDAGCTVQWHGATKGFVNLLGKNVAFSNVIGQAAAQLPNLGNATAIFHNNAQSGHLETDGTNTYSWSIDGSGNYRLLKTGGTGLLDLAQGSGVSLRTSKVGFQGTAAIAKPTVTGAKGSNAALGSLITALANYGLITDSTTT